MMKRIGISAAALALFVLAACTTTIPVDGKNACKYITSTASGAFAPADMENTPTFPPKVKVRTYSHSIHIKQSAVSCSYP